MVYSEAIQGRVFVIRLEHGDVLHKEIEELAREKGIHAAALIAVGGADKGSTLVVGPEDGDAVPVSPMRMKLPEAHEVTGTGTLFRDEEGTPLLHMHLASGRKDKTITGCVREGVKTWQIMEIILIELLDSTASRELDPKLGFKLLKP